MYILREPRASTAEENDRNQPKIASRQTCFWQKYGYGISIEHIMRDAPCASEI